MLSRVTDRCEVCRPSDPRAASRLPFRSASLVALAIVWVVCLLSHGGNLDRRLFSEIHGHSANLLTVADRVSTLGSPQFLSAVLAVGAGVLLWSRRIRATVVLIALVLSCRIVRFVQEAAFALPRPNASVAHTGGLSPYGFPSGHATNSMATYLALALVLCSGSRWRPPAAAVAVATSLAVGMSRVLLGVHWPSDVVGGWSFGCLWIFGILRLTDPI